MDPRASDNPYAAPTTTDVPQLETLQYFRRGDLLFFRDGAELPKRCIRTNEEVDETGWRKRKQLTWIPQWTLIFIVVGFLPFLLLSVFLQKKAKIIYSLSKEARESLFRKRCIGLGMIAVGILTAVAGGSLIQADPGVFVMFGGILVAFLGLIVSVSVAPLAVRGARGEWFQVKGCSEKFLAGLPGA